jgi:ATP-dependent Clp endopeptidase proteolytic subunit ClpP
MPSSKQMSKRTPRFWGMENDGTELELLLYGVIGDDQWSDVDVKTFAEDLAAQGDVQAIRVRINSPGGSVFAGAAIYNSLRNHPAPVAVYVDGLAASAATIVAMAGDEIVLPPNAMMMIHNPWSVAVGESSDMRKAADVLDKVRDSMLATYRERTGKSDDELREIMDAETWLTAAEAVEMGFADRIDDGAKVEASIKDGLLAMNGVVFASVGDMLKNGQPVQAATEPVRRGAATSEPAGKTVEEKIMNIDELKAKHADLYAQVLAEGQAAGAAAERARMQAIDEIAVVGHEKLVADAKYGEQPMAAADLAVAIVKAEKAAGAAFLQGRAADAQAAAIDNGDTAPAVPDEETEIDALAKAAVANIRR